jgi:SGNH hydrolase-like domain, acetyltransferase AlgX
MRRYEKYLIAAVVAGPLLMALVGAPLLRADTDDLNRNPVAFPSITLSGLLQSETFGSIGAWLRDRVPLRREVRNLDTKIDRGVFHDVDDKMLLQGREGWLYFEPAIALGLRPDFDPDDVRSGILRLKEEVESAGKTFLFAFGPHKPTIYPQYLADRDAQRQTVVRERLEAFRTLMREQPIDGFIDAWDVLEAKARSASEPIYYPRDTHWTPLGASAMTRLIVDSLRPGLSKSLVETEGKPRPYIPDLVKFAGLDQPETIHVWDYKRKGVSVEKSDVASIETTRTIQYTAQANRRSPLLPKIVVICDSYGTSMHLSFSQFFESTTFIHLQSSDTDLARKALAEADIVMFLRVERFLWPMSEEKPFADDSEEVLRLLSTLHRHANEAPDPHLTAASSRG